MNKLAIVFSCTAAPAMAHHEVVMTVGLFPAALWVGGIAAAAVAAFWAKHRRK